MTFTMSDQNPPTITDDPAHAAAAASSGLSTPMTPPMQADDTIDSQAQSEQIQGAYAVQPFYWKDKELAPMAISREGDWLMHRTCLGCPPLEHIISQPQAMLLDALRVLWFLSHEPSAWLSVPSMHELDGRWQMRSPHDRALALEMQIRAWADEHVGNDEHALAVRLFYDIYNGTRETRTTVKPPKDYDSQRAGK